MRWHHTILAVLVAVIWGIAFIATKIALDSFTPPQLAVLRFLIASIPVLYVARPPVSWPMLILIGLTLFTGQFLLQFFGIANGMPPGLASVIVQTQAFFTVIFATLFLQERPSRQQQIGIMAAFVGLGFIGLTVGRGLTGIGFALTLGSAISWGIGNILVKRLPNRTEHPMKAHKNRAEHPVKAHKSRAEHSVKTHKNSMFALMVWLSLVTPLPALMLAVIQNGPLAVPHALAASTWSSLVAILYLGLIATVLAYAIWGALLSRYSTATVAPFALLTPVVGAIASAIVFGEQFEPLRLFGMLLMVIGFVVAVIPFKRKSEEPL